ncbi:hypothetical protein [Streptomyces smyrnaeus]|uniref:hypothetical protein n=1 Tax=Streptomyces smyrnaeus TaxID=1387713 RepID=UPI0033CB024D
MSKPGRKRPPKGDAKYDSLAAKDDAAATKQRRERADLLQRMRAKTARQEWSPGTVGEDVMTVHMTRGGKALCGAVGAVDEWQRAVSCPACLKAA